jgi:outer membrane protein OmpA-like peptidoglycan-associated protein
VKVSVTVDDGRGCADSATKTINVNSPQPPPNVDPTVTFGSESCLVVGQPQIEGQVTDGERIRVIARANDPNGDDLTYEWQTSAGRLIGSGPEVTIDTTNVTAGPGTEPIDIVITVRVSDGRGGSAAASTTCRVSSVTKPAPIRLDDLMFSANSARVDNVHKAMLDDVALRLQQDPTTILVVDGHQDQAERANLSRQRAENVKRYLESEKGIDPNRIVVREFGASRPDPSGDPKRNRRVELWLIPRGADMPQ